MFNPLCIFFIYFFLYLFINFPKWPGSLIIEQALLRGPEKKKRKKISNTANKNDNTLETTEKETEMQKQNWGGRRIDSPRGQAQPLWTFIFVYRYLYFGFLEKA